MLPYNGNMLFNKANLNYNYSIIEYSME